MLLAFASVQLQLEFVTEFLQDFELLAAGDVQIVITEALRGAREAQPDEMEIFIGQFDVPGRNGSHKSEMIISRSMAESRHWILEGSETNIGA